MMIPGSRPDGQNFWTAASTRTVPQTPRALQEVEEACNQAAQSIDWDLVRKMVEPIKTPKTRKPTKRARCLLCGKSKKLRVRDRLCDHSVSVFVAGRYHGEYKCRGSGTKFHVPVNQLTPKEVKQMWGIE